ncbi:hypothetical protein U9M48_019268 [Paspalum notatum var. saurae]|uniref:Uncharacterized protein n=1 Tax=Paspalum notatum var. saurae TaxID=547442 RepID=A0AAQ3TB37_PASNO
MSSDERRVTRRPTNPRTNLIFGHSSGLRTNFAKSSVDEDLLVLSDLMDSEFKDFPCNYIGIPLTIQKPTKTDLLPLIDKIASNLPKWKACLLNRAGQLVVVRAVFTAIPIHMMIALDLPKWGRQNANGGNCIVSCDKVQRPCASGGFGYKKQILLDLVKGYQFKYLATPKLCLMSPQKQRFGMVRILNSRLISGCTVVQLLSWPLILFS